MVLCQDGQLVPSGCCQSLYTGIVWNSTKSVCDHIRKRWNLRTRNNYNQPVENRWASGQPSKTLLLMNTMGQIQGKSIIERMHSCHSCDLKFNSFSVPIAYSQSLSHKHGLEQVAYTTILWLRSGQVTEIQFQISLACNKVNI